MASSQKTRGKTSRLIEGRLNVHRDGYAFLIPDKPVPGVEGDVYITKEEAHKAMHGDRVAIRLKRGDRGRVHGEIIQVVRRAHPSVVGEFRVRRRGNYVVPHEDRIRQWIEIPEGMEFPSKKASANRVGARAVDVKTVAELEGMIVNVEIVDFGDGERPVGRVTEILGKADDFGVDVEILIRSHHIPHEFPDDVLEQARSIPSAIPEEENCSAQGFSGS